MNTIKVYDEFRKQFRFLNPKNYNDDLVIGAVLFEKAALEIIEKSFVICGYLIISKKDKNYYPIDIHSDRIVMLEGTYNCLPKELKKELTRYNTTNFCAPVWSRFFLSGFFWEVWTALLKMNLLLKCVRILRKIRILLSR